MGELKLKKYITNEERQQIVYNMLVDFVKFCDKHELYYTLAGGTLLGAIRHGGFIPWDDDIDINMPREDFEKLRKLLAKEQISSNISFDGVNTKSNLYPFIRIYDNRTEQKMEDCNGLTGIWIDIFPVDCVPENEVDQKVLFMKARFWRASVIAINADLRNSKGFKKNIAKAIFKIMAFILGKRFFVTQASKNAQQYNNQETNYIGGILWGYGRGEILTKDEYFNSEKVKFNDEYFNAPRAWEKYLTGLYGDYMKLPPKDKQVAHNFKTWWK